MMVLIIRFFHCEQPVKKEKKMVEQKFLNSFKTSNSERGPRLEETGTVIKKLEETTKVIKHDS